MADSNFSNHVGLGNAGSYQVSGFPWVTGSSATAANCLDTGKTIQHTLPFVSKSITLINPNSNNGEDLRLHFQSGSSAAITADGVTGEQATVVGNNVHYGHHYVTVPAGNASGTLDVKCAKFYITNLSTVNDLKYEVFAELTRIPVGRMPVLTGSGVTHFLDQQG